jgi:hypothetical protein
MCQIYEKYNKPILLFYESKEKKEKKKKKLKMKERLSCHLVTKVCDIKDWSVQVHLAYKC